MNDILVNLNIISQIKPHDKIYVNSDNYISIEEKTGYQSIIRFFYNNSRIKNIYTLNNFYSSVYKYIENLLNSKYLTVNNEKKNIENDNFINTFNSLTELNVRFKDSLKGIQNLQETYEDDVVTKAKLDIIISTGNNYISKLEKKIYLINKIYFNEENKVNNKNK